MRVNNRVETFVNSRYRRRRRRQRRRGSSSNGNGKHDGVLRRTRFIIHDSLRLSTGWLRSERTAAAAAARSSGPLCILILSRNGNSHSFARAFRRVLLLSYEMFAHNFTHRVWLPRRFVRVPVGVPGGTQMFAQSPDISLFPVLLSAPSPLLCRQPTNRHDKSTDKYRTSCYLTSTVTCCCCFLFLVFLVFLRPTMTSLRG